MCIRDRLNVETERQVADYYGVMSIPTLILFKDGEEVLRLTGLRKKEAMPVSYTHLDVYKRQS